MLTQGDVVALELGNPAGSEAGFHRLAIVVTAQRILEGLPNVVHVVPLTTTVSRGRAEVALEPDSLNGLQAISAAQCQHIRAVATRRIDRTLGNVGPAVLRQVREVLALIMDI